MKTRKKLLSLLMTVILLTGLFAVLAQNAGVHADEIGQPKITLKRVKKGTAVNVTISKTKNAQAYIIYLESADNAYSKYLYNGVFEREAAILDTDGKKKTTYTLKGLPKGTYTIKVAACTRSGEWGSLDRYSAVYSKPKSVKIKAVKQKQKKENTYDFSKAKVGDVITFGSYEQSGDFYDGKEDIEWIVLSKDKDQMLLLSKYILDTVPYNISGEPTTWEDCNLRKWLNKEFYNSAFSKKEKKLVKTVTLKNEDNPVEGSEGGNDTVDKVFLLSFSDVTNSSYGFSSDYEERDINRRCASTNYAFLQSYYSYRWSPGVTKDGEESWHWMLRTPGQLDYEMVDYGNYSIWTSSVNYEGMIEKGDTSDYGVRPAIYVSLK